MESYIWMSCWVHCLCKRAKIWTPGTTVHHFSFCPSVRLHTHLRSVDSRKVLCILAPAYLPSCGDETLARGMLMDRLCKNSVNDPSGLPSKEETVQYLLYNGAKELCLVSKARMGTPVLTTEKFHRLNKNKITPSISAADVGSSTRYGHGGTGQADGQLERHGSLVQRLKLRHNMAVECG